MVIDAIIKTIQNLLINVVHYIGLALLGVFIGMVLSVVTDINVFLEQYTILTAETIIPSFMVLVSIAYGR